MKFTIQVLIESPDALPLSVPVQTIERSCEHVEDVGLRGRINGWEGTFCDNSEIGEVTS
jgi:hypothetical protein